MKHSVSAEILPDSLEYLGILAYESSGLISVSIPKNIKNINELTFSACSALSTVVLHEEIFSIGDGAFGECRNLHNLIMPSAIKIGDGAFRGCTLLEHLVLPENLAELGSNAFYQCTGLISVDFPSKHITKIKRGTFN